KEVFQDKTQVICRALENAGYIIPYGVKWEGISISQTRWMLSGPNSILFTIPDGSPGVHVTVDWNIPADMNWMRVDQETVDSLAVEAKNICRIVQREAVKQGIGPVAVDIGLTDLVVGFG